MASTIKIGIAPDGTATFHASSILYDLYEDYTFFKEQASKIDKKKDPLAYKRMTRASLLAFSNYFEGVLNRWVAMLDPSFNNRTSTSHKLELIRQSAKRGTLGHDLPPLQNSHPNLRGLRNKISHLKLSDDDFEITEKLLSGQLFHEAKCLHNWLRIASHSLKLPLHDDPNQLLKPFVDQFDKSSTVSEDNLSEEDEELLRMAEMTFLELDAREAADGKP